MAVVCIGALAALLWMDDAIMSTFGDLDETISLLVLSGLATDGVYFDGTESWETCRSRTLTGLDSIDGSSPFNAAIFCL